jgi:hypothetical protein
LPDWAKGRAGGLGEGAQARLSEVAKLAGCSILLAHYLACSCLGVTWQPGDHRPVTECCKGCEIEN